MPANEGPADRGLAQERTALAWNRSGLAVIVCVAVLLRHLWPLRGADQLVALGLAAFVVIAWAVSVVVIWTYQNRYHRSLLDRNTRLGLLAAGTVLLAIGALTLTLLTPG